MSSPGWSGAFAAEPGVGCRWAATLKGSNKEHLAGELPALVNPFRGWPSSVTVGFAMLNPRLFKFVPSGDR